MPSGYTKKQRIGALYTDGSANIRNGHYTVFQGGYRFDYNTSITNYSSYTPSGTNASLGISVPSVSNVIGVVQGRGETGTTGADVLDVDFGHNNETLSANKAIEIRT